jgi:hypothetical protein
MTDAQGTIAHKTHDGRNTPEELRDKWGVEPGQIWLIPARGGWHRLLVDDATKAENLDRLLDSRRITAVCLERLAGEGPPALAMISSSAIL